MKNFTLLLFTLLILSKGYAQNTPSAAQANTPLTPSILKLSLPQHLSFPDAGNQNRKERPAPSPDYQFGNSVYDSIYSWVLKSPFKQWNYTYKDIDMTYDPNSNLGNYVGLLWDTTKWKNYVHYSYAYNPDNLITSQIAQMWTDTGWVNSSYQTYSYNGNDKNTSYVFRIWKNNAWANSERDTFTYNGYDSLAHEVLEEWNDTTSTWVGFYQQIRSYNTNHLMDTLLVQGSNYGGPWANNQMFTYTYKTDTTIELVQNWAANTWKNTYLYTYTYNSAGLLTSQVIQTPNGSSWVNYSLYQLTYNTANLNTIFLDEIWQNNAWAGIIQMLYAYNSDNLDTSEITQINYSSWANSSKIIKRYNANNAEIESLNYTYDSQSVGDTLTTLDSTYYYLAGTAGINSVAGNSFNLSIYPNPSGNVINANIKLSQPSNLQLRLVDMLGRTRWVSNIGTVSNYQSNISVTNLADGVYLLEMITGSGSETREVVVEK